MFGDSVNIKSTALLCNARHEVENVKHVKDGSWTSCNNRSPKSVLTQGEEKIES